MNDNIDHQVNFRGDEGQKEGEDKYYEQLTAEQSSAEVTLSYTRTPTIPVPPRYQELQGPQTVGNNQLHEQHQQEQQPHPLLHNLNSPRQHQQEEEEEGEDEPHMRYYRYVVALAESVGFRPPPGPPTREWFQQHLERKQRQAHQQAQMLQLQQHLAANVPLQLDMTHPQQEPSPAWMALAAAPSQQRLRVQRQAIAQPSVPRDNHIEEIIGASASQQQPQNDAFPANTAMVGGTNGRGIDGGKDQQPETANVDATVAVPPPGWRSH